MVEWIIESILDWLGDCFQVFLNFLLELLPKIWELICRCGRLLFDFFFHEQTGFAWWMIRKFLEWGFGLLEQFPDLAAFLDQYRPTFNTVMVHVGGLNKFFPIVESAVLLATYLGFVALFLCAKLFWKLIRG